MSGDFELRLGHYLGILGVFCDSRLNSTNVVVGKKICIIVRVLAFNIKINVFSRLIEARHICYIIPMITNES